jgi:hypothetical protein
MHDGKKVKIVGKVFKRDIRLVEPMFAFCLSGDCFFHKGCLIKQIRGELEIEEREFERKKERLLKEIKSIEEEKDEDEKGN